jgi:predicted metal-dependent hydrolase
MDVADHAVLARGLELFNNGEYFACHEVWEELWKHASGEERRALQGLIQAAVAILHAERGNYRGAQSVFRKAVRNLAGVPNDCLGLRIGDFRSALDAFFAHLADDFGAGDTDSSGPNIRERRFPDSLQLHWRNSQL